jgi:hypothetical protein
LAPLFPATLLIEAAAGPAYGWGVKTREGEQGVALVEFAFASTILILVLMASFQFALIYMQSYSVRQVTRDTARWLAINPDTTDSALTARAQSIAMPGMRTASYVRVTPSPACPALSGGRCTSRSPGNTISVEIEYDLATAIFLPTTFGFGGLQVTFPTRLPPFKVTVLQE